jgi:hypothetical protein
LASFYARLQNSSLVRDYWYLSGVPELMALAGARFERFADVGECDDE